MIITVTLNAAIVLLGILVTAAIAVLRMRVRLRVVRQGGGPTKTR